ncbi:hypothetical protein RJT51_18520 [Klebsiella variicola]|nr:hypothetical protein [Klebsiella variicola]WNN05441.1 hypothetical protein RJT51_18520 [Klebsiella variicola]HDG7844261.1 hypothetical protein [Klebsiella quasipneumoniae]
MIKQTRRSGVSLRGFFGDLAVNFPQANATARAEVGKIVQTRPLANSSASSLHKHGYIFTPPQAEQSPAAAIRTFYGGYASQYACLIQLSKGGLLSGYHSHKYKPVIC